MAIAVFCNGEQPLSATAAVIMQTRVRYKIKHPVRAADGLTDTAPTTSSGENTAAQTLSHPYVNLLDVRFFQWLWHGKAGWQWIDSARRNAN
jgi:hypothetical protein